MLKTVETEVDAPTAQRISGRADVEVVADATDRQTRLSRLYQNGSAKIRFPKSYDPQLEAVLINTAGGLTGGDRLDWHVKVGTGASLRTTSQACEKLYRASSGTARIEIRLEVGDNARLDWLPQETIVFNGSAMDRTVVADLHADARLLAVESFVLGRKAMGEVVKTTFLRDRWRIHRDGRLIHADDIVIDPAVLAKLDSPALMNGASAFATLVYVGPESDEQMARLVARLRNSSKGDQCACSTTGNKVIARVLAADSYELRRTLTPLLNEISEGRSLPRVWTT